MKPSKTLATAVIAVIAAAIYFFFPSMSEQTAGEAATGNQAGQVSQQQQEFTPAAGDGTAKEALAALESITVSAPVNSEGYDRDKFGSAWSDVDGNSCDTRIICTARGVVALRSM